MNVIITFRNHENPFIPIEAEMITPDAFLEEKNEICVAVGNRSYPLSEVADFSIVGEASSVDDIEVLIRGDTSRVKRVGEYMSGGAITIEGDIGMHCGNFMSGGRIEILGSADGWLGREMKGGEIICHGDAGDYCASGYRGGRRGMRGGSVEVFGSVGDFACEHIAGGEVLIHGNTGDFACAEMKGGTVTILGDTSRVCANMSAGTCYVYGSAVEMIPTFEKKGTVNHDGVLFHHFRGDVANRGNGDLYTVHFTYLQ
ncbi:MAG: Formylmethanofuran dehydrogenase subunit C [Methanomicrobiales archaeon 53_19]|jgi:formylmethanofuran dehydrogenase subunit C|uniref:formylmethanofuran dehydrogenase subunit C n=1 Tax=Methanocalculus sp. TaxID=2004547 RepID=UPI00074AA8EB|nr:formylmethanofuran dehydrogenase subunit C [Methanocalculus sp.]KUK71084.1 MAG: Formylmethanofuran dehydrogenase subunit C [Methanocalculus sp. 52_23]KUL03938.1 MAG: Formylmethanofuran dehydrogenase subunit C [Methanomicrobiales archaeon 53_19]HIJ06326.1 formylmethanofuran dehydrogenase subunit C [Methanocalculus sp.]